MKEIEFIHLINGEEMTEHPVAALGEIMLDLLANNREIGFKTDVHDGTLSVECVRL